MNTMGSGKILQNLKSAFEADLDNEWSTLHIVLMQSSVVAIRCTSWKQEYVKIERVECSKNDEYNRMV